MTSFDEPNARTECGDTSPVCENLLAAAATYRVDMVMSVGR